MMSAQCCRKARCQSEFVCVSIIVYCLQFHCDNCAPTCPLTMANLGCIFREDPDFLFSVCGNGKLDGIEVCDGGIQCTDSCGCNPGWKQTRVKSVNCMLGKFLNRSFLMLICTCLLVLILCCFHNAACSDGIWDWGRM